MPHVTEDRNFGLADPIPTGADHVATRPSSSGGSVIARIVQDGVLEDGAELVSASGWYQMVEVKVAKRLWLVAYCLLLSSTMVVEGVYSGWVRMLVGIDAMTRQKYLE